MCYNTVEAKGEVLEELRGLASHVPFDDRPNPDIKLDDLSSSLMRDFFVNIGSKLKDQDLSGNNMMDALEQMNMLETRIYAYNSERPCRAPKERVFATGRWSKKRLLATAFPTIGLIKHQNGLKSAPQILSIP